MGKRPRKTHFAVRKGAEGARIYRSWEECLKVVSGFRGAEFKGFFSEAEAQAYIDGAILQGNLVKNEAAASMNAGRTESRGYFFTPSPPVVVDLTDSPSPPSKMFRGPNRFHAEASSSQHKNYPMKAVSSFGLPVKREGGSQDISFRGDAPSQNHQENEVHEPLANSLQSPSSSHRRAMTEEQEYIVSLARGPNQYDPRIVRVTAGAGTGKTTTLEALARRLSELGHKKVLYVTFNKTAAFDAQRRLTNSATCKTIHSAAFSVFPELWERGGAGGDGGGLVDDTQLDRKILTRAFSRDEIFEFTSGVSDRKKKGIQLQVAFYIRKTCTSFLQGRKTEVEFFNDPWNTYYPAKLWHKAGKQRGMPLDPGRFYVDQAKKLWLRLRPGPGPPPPAAGGGCPGGGAAAAAAARRGRAAPELLLYDGVMKAAQLEGAALDCTALLVDEAQDCTECQIDWLKTQIQLGQKPDVFFVGDAVQTIYSFRGARSKFLMNIKDAEDATLTKSFRFGPNIATVANTLLFLKEKSPQKDWKPYRLIGGGGAGAGRLFASAGDPRAPPRRTLLAFTNLALLQAALPVGGRIISINGDGSNSGIRKWQSTLREVGEVYELTQRPGRVSFKEWDDEDGPMTYDQFCRDVEARELTKYSLHIGLVDKFQEDTMKVAEEFQREVVDRRHPPEGADLVLSTIHAAKGMEWDHVEVVDDASMAPLARFSFDGGGGGGGGFRPASALRGAGGGAAAAQFAQKGWGDEVHLWYVAVTRARRTLVLPPRLLELLAALEAARALAARLLAEGGPAAERWRRGRARDPLDSSDSEGEEGGGGGGGDGVVWERVAPGTPVCAPPLPLPAEQPLAAEDVPPRERRYLLPPFAALPEAQGVVVDKKRCPQVWTEAQILDIYNGLALPWANEVSESNQGIQILLPPSPPSSESLTDQSLRQPKIPPLQYQGSDSRSGHYAFSVVHDNNHYNKVVVKHNKKEVDKKEPITVIELL